MNRVPPAGSPSGASGPQRPQLNAQETADSIVSTYCTLRNFFDRRFAAQGVMVMIDPIFERDGKISFYISFSKDDTARLSIELTREDLVRALKKETGLTFNQGDLIETPINIGKNEGFRSRITDLIRPQIPELRRPGGGASSKDKYEVKYVPYVGRDGHTYYLAEKVNAPEPMRRNIHDIYTINERFNSQENKKKGKPE